MAGTHSRNKGARGELLIVSILRRCFPNVRRGRQYDTARECDIEGTSLRLENKFTNTITYGKLLKWLEQNTKEGKLWSDTRPALLITKRDREPPVFHGFLEDLVKIVETLFYRYEEKDKEEVKELFGDVDEDRSYR